MVYVAGQMSELHRQSVEPMSLRAGVPPRSLQAFLGLLEWDEDRLMDRLQQNVARDHAHPWAIGVVDETGCGKDGRHTAWVQRQWCGSLGKVENCVVSVHRLSATAAPVSEVRNLLNHSPAFQGQAWAPIHIKNGEKGAIVREVKAAGSSYGATNCPRGPIG